MRHFYLLLITSLGLLVCQVLSATTLNWDRTEVNLDMDPDQEEVWASFNVTNNGSETVRIARVKTSCGCTGSIIDRKILEPGDSTEIIATFNKGKRQGLNRNRLEVFIDNKPDPVALLQMNVQIPKLIDAMPQVIYWSPSSSKSERRITVTLDKRYVKPGMEIDYDRKAMNVVSEQNADNPHVHILRLTPKSYETPYRGEITVRSTRKDGSKIKARILTLVQPST